MLVLGDSGCLKAMLLDQSHAAKYGVFLQLLLSRSAVGSNDCLEVQQILLDVLHNLKTVVEPTRQHTLSSIANIDLVWDKPAAKFSILT